MVGLPAWGMSGGQTPPQHVMKCYTELQTFDRFTGMTYTMEDNDGRIILK
jgi:hypothetical protein